jgi:VanZ family protein
LDEVTQPFFYRAAEPLDWVYDMVGAAIGCAIGAALDRFITGWRRAA